MHVTNGNLKMGSLCTCDSVEPLRDKTLKLIIAVRLPHTKSDVGEMWAVVN